MVNMSNTDYQLFTTIAKMKQSTLRRSMKNFLEKYYPKENVLMTEDYILCKGDSPIMVVAHMDTVFKSPPQKIYYDQRQRIMWSPDGLGADDRAGVFAIIKIIQRGHRPHVCFTTNEEVGGLGALALTREVAACPFDIKYVIELDREGTNDCVFYSCYNEEFEEFIETYGFVTDWGTFTDICDICPTWHVAGVNLSVGYKNEHSTNETLNTNALYSTIGKVCKMIKDADTDTVKHFEYIPDPYSKYYKKIGQAYGFYDEWDDYMTGCDYYGDHHPLDTMRLERHQCCKCHRIFPEEDMLSVKSKEYANATNYYCIDCVSDNVNWCDTCGEPFEISEPDEVRCPTCAGKKLKEVFIN